MKKLASQETINLLRGPTSSLKGKKAHKAVGGSGVQSEKVLSEQSISPKVKNAQYAVRGRVVLRAEEMKEQDWRPFKKFISCNVGNPQILGQSPYNFVREVTDLFLA
jgi:hypothetical protein